ncbi:MAG: hypothetical protein FWC11_01310 [Firmicutes bacterium]|nr:hypothetical protein [Bacillota bacterium]MCL2255479.1 hypothetical protein [Bacillota bacterium]
MKETESKDSTLISVLGTLVEKETDKFVLNNPTGFMSNGEKKPSYLEC